MVFIQISRPSMPQPALLLLLMTTFAFDTVMVYTLGGQLVHELGGSDSDPGSLNGPYGICVDDSRAVHVADYYNRCVQVF